MRSIVVAGLIASTLACGSAQAGDKLGAVLGGVAVGAVGGAIIGSALTAHAQPAPPPVYYQAAPPPPPVVRTIVAPDPFDDQAYRLHMGCEAGDRRSCIRFGILIGQHRERVAQWRRTHPDFFSYE